MFIYFIFQINTSTLSTINTAAHASSATVIKLFSLYAAISATKNPAAPEMMLSVAFRMAGKVMAARLDKRAFDLVFCKSEGQHTDEIGDCCHHQDIEIYIMTHEMLPPSLPPDRNKLPGLLPEVL